MNTNYQTVTWKDPYPYDNSLLPVDLAQIEGVKSGSQLTVGTHTVKYEATDHAKNKKQCSFRIFVRGKSIWKFFCLVFLVQNLFFSRYF
jgi:hypothetical protein